LRTDPEASERRLRRTSWLLVGVLSLAGLVFGARFAAAVAAGGALSAWNLEGLIRLVNLVTSPSPKASWRAVLSLCGRYLLLGVGLFVIVSVWRVNVLGLSLGLSAPAAAVFLELARDTLREFRSHSDIDT
jgi:hypothetical protein